MYRADRSSKESHSERAPMVLATLVAAGWLALGVACAAGEKDKQNESVAKTTAPTVAAGRRCATSSTAARRRQSRARTLISTS